MKRNWMMIVLGLLCATTAQAQWRNGEVTVRTNGNVFESGDKVKVELLALEKIDEPFYAQVIYAYTETVEEKETDDKGETKTTYKQVERQRKRDASPVIELLDKYQSFVLDDRFHFGDVTPAGGYEIRVCIFNPYTKVLMTVLRTCIKHSNPEAAQVSQAGCDTYLRSFKRYNNSKFLTFDGWFRQSSNYVAVLMQGGRVVTHLRVGAYTSGSDELNLSGQELEGLTGKTFDVLIHDFQRGISSTLSRVTLPVGN
ncbi:MAG: hypothetical protein HOP19_24270 [Acidobacteria bacterium]|nr:hypothetical protein [Acidobacteriota bacterium]